MAYPDWVIKHKTKGTELRKIRDKYYLYKVTSKWDPKKKKAKKVTLGQAGVITEEYGLIPTGMKRKGRIPAGQSPLKNPHTQEEKSVGNFLDNFSTLEDPRSERNQLHSVDEIFLLTFCAVICGADGWQDVEDYGKSKLEYLKQYLDYSNGIPSDDTIRRFFRATTVEKFAELFREWVGNIVKKEDIKVIAFDGKSSRRSFDGEQKMLHTVSAYATEVRLVLGQEKVSEKSNEIKAIPKMLEWLDVKDHIVTIDAMGCQYAIADQIIAKSGNYIFSLKGNQGSLSDDVELYFEDKDREVLESHIDYDKGHGRIETRKCWVNTDIQWLRETHPHWKSIKSIIKIESTREIKDKSSVENRYYISSLEEKSEKMLKNIRSHWAIENSLHWILDMSFSDDQSRIRKENAPHAIAIMRHIALNVLQLAKQDRQSINGLRKICGWNNSALDLVLSKKIS